MPSLQEAKTTHACGLATDPHRGLVSIILATFNEREHILHTIEEIFRHVPEPVEVIVVDDDSTDLTWQLVGALTDSRVKLIRRVATCGLASAFMRGIIESRGEIIGWMDADMCMHPRLLPQMIDRLATSDVVIGSRYVAGGQDVRHPLRVHASRLINAFAGLVLGHGIKDYDSGFVILKRSVLDAVLPMPRGYGEYFIEFIYTCCRKELRVSEVPYTFTDRTVGMSKSFRSLWQFLLLGATYILRIVQARLRQGE